GRQYVDLTGFTQGRLCCYVNAAGSIGSFLTIEYSTNNGSSWSSIGASGSISVAIGGSVSGAQIGSWFALAVGAQTEVLLRVSGTGGNSTADPQILSAHAQF